MTMPPDSSPQQGIDDNGSNRTRTYCRVDEATDTEEWFFIDGYDDVDLFGKMTGAWTGDDPAVRDPTATEVVETNVPWWRPAADD